MSQIVNWRHSSHSAVSVSCWVIKRSSSHWTLNFNMVVYLCEFACKHRYTKPCAVSDKFRVAVSRLKPNGKSVPCSGIEIDGCLEILCLSCVCMCFCLLTGSFCVYVGGCIPMFVFLSLIKVQVLYWLNPTSPLLITALLCSDLLSSLPFIIDRDCCMILN